MREIVRFRFNKPVERDDIEDDVCLAIFCCECLHGQPRIRLEVGGFLVSDDGSCCVLDVRGPAGEDTARILAGLCTARVGDGAFTIERLVPSLPDGFTSPGLFRWSAKSGASQRRSDPDDCVMPHG